MAINRWTVAFAILAVFFIALLVAAFVDANMYQQTVAAINTAITNSNQCADFNSDTCTLVLDLNLTIPVGGSTTYSSEMALYSANLVGCVEFPSINDEPEAQFPTPTNLHVETTIIYNAKILGVVWTSADTIFIAFRGTRTAQE